MKLLKTLFHVCLSLLFTSNLLAQDATYKNMIGMEFVLIKPGSFVLGKFQPPYPKRDTMNAGHQQGSDKGYNAAEYILAEELAKRDAMPGLTVTIEKPFYMGKFEVTQAQWKEVMGSNPSVFQQGLTNENTEQYPVENITWKKIQKFLKRLNSIDKRRSYRLPTEFEWEYAARAGTEEDIPWSEIRLSAWLGTCTTNKVGQKKSNAWGLYDMLGNVWEWVQDFYNEKIFADPMPPAKGREHVLKGASFVGDVKNATYMTHAAGPGNGWDVGFRVVMEVE